MTVSIEVRPWHLAVVVAVVAAATGLAVWWGAPARSQPAGPAAVDSFAFVARADNPVDALAASSLAGQLGAPVYLTPTGRLNEQARQGLQGAQPRVVVLAGGTAALAPQVEQQIREVLPQARLRRFAGAERTETARLLNELPDQLGIDRPVVTGVTVAGDVGIDGTLTVAGTDLQAALSALSARVKTLEAEMVVLRSRLADVSRTGDKLVFSGMNLQVVNGRGHTATTNGLGNLIVGYKEDHISLGCQPSDADCQYRGDGVADSRADRTRS
ncbi:MAG TPA: cell wall-binding repeat-containing protein [Nitriliruptorales bacterium]|nr:cell wall-binding repeat-containing protein [Nitriliruptorales bacterium]